MITNGMRVRCLVPFCNHTRGQRKGEPPIEGDEEWICGEHWRAVPAYVRRRQSRIMRAYRRRFGSDPWYLQPKGPKRHEALRMMRVWGKAWEACKRRAIESAGGI